LEKHGSPYRNFLKIPRLSLGNLQTPIEPCDRLSKEIPGAPHIYIKRDDSSGYLVGGNKIRKLEYVMADVLRKKATTVMTVGSVQSNHARITAMVAKRMGLKCVLVLNGEFPDQPKGNLFLTSLLGIEIIKVESREDRLSKMNQIARELEAGGESVYKIPLGASDEIGSYGLTAAFKEVADHEKKTGMSFDAIFIGSSSGGTQAGLEVGKRLFNKDTLRIIGISPDDPAASIKERIIAAAGPMLSRLGLDNSIRPDQLCVDDRYVGGGYGFFSPESEEATALFLRAEGILLDPVYTSKTAAALLDYCRKGEFQPKNHVLFWHTGGLIALFK
jgi:D-cysteine desulfhydrase family pyridoxal phosphate-dependent enzyme